MPRIPPNPRPPYPPDHDREWWATAVALLAILAGLCAWLDRIDLSPPRAHVEHLEPWQEVEP